MSFTRRQLTGFDEFLDWRPLEFVDEIPDALVCSICGVIPAFPKRLVSCCHVFCPTCYEEITERERICPVDRASFVSVEVETLDSRRAGVKDLRIRCPNSPRGCTFVGELSRLYEHFPEQCRLAEVQCPRCGMVMPQKTALDHYLQHCTGRPTSNSSTVRKETSFQLATATQDGQSLENSSRISGGSTGSRRRDASSADRPRKSRSRTRSPGVRKASSAETGSTMVAAKGALVAKNMDSLHRDAARPVHSASGGTSETPSHESSLIKSSSGTKRSQHKTTEAANSTLKASSQDTQLHGIVDSMFNNTLQALSTASTSKQQPPFSLGARSTPSGTKPTAVSQRNKPAATAVPAGLAFCYVTDLEDAQSRLSCGEEVVLRSDRFLMADCLFRVHARLRRDMEGVVFACFALCVCGGTWQRIAECPNTMNLVLVHPWDQSRNVRLPLASNPVAVRAHQATHSDRWDFWLPTSELKLGDVKAFLSSGTVCVAVEVE